MSKFHAIRCTACKMRSPTPPSSGGPKDHHFDDIALQAFVLNGAGIVVSSIELVHVNTAYVRGPGGICWQDFFARVEVHDAVAARRVDLPSRLQAMRDCLGMVELPDAEPGSQCGTPYACEFWDRCTANKPADWTFHLPRLSQTRVNELKALGIESNLYSSLWASCDELRGGMDASQYKDYVLFMLFIKHVSDKYGDSDDFAPPVTIPKGASFKCPSAGSFASPDFCLIFAP